eukprot:3246909-Pleurochrysis_carterae.AAC.1
MSLSSMTRVSLLRRLQGKKLHLGRKNRQFPRYGRKPRHNVCVLAAFSCARSLSLAPSAPLAASLHVMRMASSCACAPRQHFRL